MKNERHGKVADVSFGCCLLSYAKGKRLALTTWAGYFVVVVYESQGAVKLSGI